MCAISLDEFKDAQETLESDTEGGTLFYINAFSYENLCKTSI